MVSSNPSNGLICLQQHQHLGNHEQNFIFLSKTLFERKIFQFSSLNFSFFLKLRLTRRLSSLAFVACIIQMFVALQLSKQGGVFKSLLWPYLFTTTPTFEKSRTKLRFSVEDIIRKEIFQFSSLNFSFFLKLLLTRRLSSLAFVACIIHIFVALQLG